MATLYAETTHLRGLGNDVSDTINSITTGSVNLFETIFGQKANRDAQAAQVELARSRAAQVAAQSISMAGLYTALPWVVGGVAALGILAFALKK